jgi:integrase
MSRPLTGSLARRGARVEASVPACRGSRRRVTRNFPDEVVARAWLQAAVAAIEAGEPVPEPQRAPEQRPATPETAAGWLERAARVWHDEHYRVGRRAGPGRADAVWRSLELHVLPYLAERAPTPAEFTRGAVFDLALLLSGRDEAAVSVRFGAELAHTTPSRLAARLRRAGVVADQRDGTPWVTLGEVRNATGVPVRIGLSAAVAAEALWALRRVEEHAVADGVLDRAVIGSVTAMDPLPAHALRTPPPAAPKHHQLACLSDVVAVAAHLHPLHQVALWVMRLLGERISEGFGLRVRSLRPTRGLWVLDVDEQAGVRFEVTDDAGRRVAVMRKDELKTGTSVRTIVLPRQVGELLHAYIGVFHTDPLTGEVDPDAPLFPGDNEEGEASQAGFRSALDKAIALAGVQRFTPHDLRAAVSSELELLGAPKVARQRYLGHDPGEEVIDEHYTPDLPDGALTVPAAEAVEGLLDREGIITLLVPTTRLPLLSSDHPLRERMAHITDTLIGLGWLLPPADDDEPTLGVRDVAAELGVSVTHAGRLLGTRIPVVSGHRGERRARLSDLEVHMAAFGPTVEDVAAELGWDYHRTLRTLHSVVPDLATDPEDRRIHLEAEQVEALRAEVRRLEELHDRAVPLPVAAAEILGRAPTTVRGWLKRGELAADPETDTTRRTFLSLASIEAHPECPPGAVRAWRRAMAGRSSSESSGRDESAITYPRQA